MADQFGMTLSEFAKGKTQPEVAQLVGVSQSAISQMMSSTRDIRVVVIPEGGFKAFEIRPVGNRRKSQAA